MVVVVVEEEPSCTGTIRKKYRRILHFPDYELSAQLQLLPLPELWLMAFPLAYNPTPQMVAPRLNKKTFTKNKQVFFQVANH